MVGWPHHILGRHTECVLHWWRTKGRGWSFPYVYRHKACKNSRQNPTASMSPTLQNWMITTRVWECLGPTTGPSRHHLLVIGLRWKVMPQITHFWQPSSEKYESEYLRKPLIYMLSSIHTYMCTYIYIYWLVVWNIFYFSIIYGNNPSCWLIFVKMVKTTNQCVYIYICTHTSIRIYSLFQDIRKPRCPGSPMARPRLAKQWPRDPWWNGLWGWEFRVFYT